MTWAERAAATGPWCQGVTWPDGTSSGVWHTERMVGELTSGVDLTGKRVRDIGCWSGVTSLHLERAGAVVTGCDVEPHCAAQFALVREAFGLVAAYEERSVYDLSVGDRASVVFMPGVYYHLRHPLLGIERAWEVASEILLLEGEVDDRGWDVPSQATFYLGEYKGDATCWWVPSLRCLQDWCKSLPEVGDLEVIWPWLDWTRRAAARIWRA